MKRPLLLTLLETETQQPSALITFTRCKDSYFLHILFTFLNHDGILWKKSKWISPVSLLHVYCVSRLKASDEHQLIIHFNFPWGYDRDVVALSATQLLTQPLSSFVARDNLLWLSLHVLAQKAFSHIIYFHLKQPASSNWNSPVLKRRSLFKTVAFLYPDLFVSIYVCVYVVYIVFLRKA